MTSEVRIYQREMPDRPVRRVLVANMKGGSGKSTLSTCLAAACARQGFKTVLVDADPQGTSSYWSRQRPADLPPVVTISGAPEPGRPAHDWMLNVPSDAERMVIDSPGGVDPVRLRDFVERVDLILIPVLPSSADINATTAFIRQVYLSGAYRRDVKRILVVGNRVNRRNKYFHQLNQFLRALKIADTIHLPDSYAFLRCVDEGIGILDLPVRAGTRAASVSFDNLYKHIEDMVND